MNFARIYAAARSKDTSRIGEVRCVKQRLYFFPSEWLDRRRVKLGRGHPPHRVREIELLHRPSEERGEGYIGISDCLGRERAPIPVVAAGPVLRSQPHQVFPDRLRRDGLDVWISCEVDPLLKAEFVVIERAVAEAFGGLGVEEANEGFG